MTRVWISALILLVLYACLQAFVLAPDGFVAGDQGTKLLQTRATLAHGPLTPWIDGLSQDLDTELQYQEPFLLRRDGSRHLIGVFPWIFPTMTAPLYWLFGLYGLYVIPALSIAATFLAALHLGRRLKTPAGGLVSAWCAVAATPMMFYGAEFWEHAPAVALTTAAVALAAPGGARGAWTRHAIAGACVALAGTLRPEAMVMLPAIAIALVIAGLRPPRSALWRVSPNQSEGGKPFAAILALLAGFVIVTMVTLPVNALVYGTLIPQHVSSNLAVGWSDYAASRVEIVRSLLLPASMASGFVAVTLLAAALALRRGASDARVYVCHAAVVLLAAGAVALPAWRWAAGVPVFTAFNITSAAHTWPFMFVCVYVMALSVSGVDGSVERYVLRTAGLFIAGAIVVMPHAGGAQWGPRFLLPAAPLVGIVAAEALGQFDLSPGHRLSIRAIVAATLSLSVMIQLLGMVVLAHTKTAHARIGRVTESLTAPGDVIVSDLFWFPELTSRLYPSRRILFAQSAEDMRAIAALAAAHGFRRISLVLSATESVYRPPALIDLADGTAFRQTDRRDIGVRNLSLFRYER